MEKNMEKTLDPLTAEQIQIATIMAGNALAVERFAKEVEEDLKGGLSGSEIMGLVFEATTMVAAVRSTIETGRKWRKQPASARNQMYGLVSDLIGGDAIDAESKVALTFDFSAKMAANVARSFKLTKAYISGLKGVGSSKV
jgi:hypothetical protein